MADSPAASTDVFAADLLRGHTDTIVLGFLRHDDSYGFEIFKRIRDATNGRHEIKGAPLSAPSRLLAKAALTGVYWGGETQGGRRKYYRIPDAALAVYRRSPGAGAVIHSHGAHTVAMTLDGRDFAPPDFEGQLYFPRVPVLRIAYERYLEDSPAQVAEVAVRLEIGVDEVDALALDGVDIEGERATVRIVAPGGTHLVVQLAAERQPPPRPISCRADELEEPLHWVVRRISPETPTPRTM